MGTSSSTSAISKPSETLRFNRLAILEGDVLNLTVDNSRVTVSLFDIKGDRVFAKSYSASTAVSLKDAVGASGTYFLRVTGGKDVLLSGKVGILR